MIAHAIKSTPQDITAIPGMYSRRETKRTPAVIIKAEATSAAMSRIIWLSQLSIANHAIVQSAPSKYRT